MLGVTSVTGMALAITDSSGVPRAVQAFRHDGSEYLLGAMAGQELVQNAFLENVSNVVTSIVQQLQHHAQMEMKL